MKHLVSLATLLACACGDSPGVLEQPPINPLTCVVAEPLERVGPSAFGRPAVVSRDGVSWVLHTSDRLTLSRDAVDVRHDFVLDGAISQGEQFLAASRTIAAVWHGGLGARFVDVSRLEPDGDAPLVTIAVPTDERLTHWLRRGDAFVLTTVREDGTTFAYDVASDGTLGARVPIGPLPDTLISAGDVYLGLRTDDRETTLVTFDTDLAEREARGLGARTFGTLVAGESGWIITRDDHSATLVTVTDATVSSRLLVQAAEGRRIESLEAAPLGDLMAVAWVDVGPSTPRLHATDAELRVVLVDPETLALRSNTVRFLDDPDTAFARPIERDGDLLLLGGAGFHAGHVASRAVVRCTP